MDVQWRRLEPLLPPEKPWTGRPNEDHRRILNGMRCVHRTGVPWRDLPKRYGPVGTVSSRFYRWRAAGIWDCVLSALQAEAGARGELDWELHSVDAIVIPAANASRFGEIALEALLDGGAIRRPGRGRPRLRRLAGDKGYSSPTARGRLRGRHIRPVIPSKSNQRRQPRFNREAYRQRNRIEMV